MLCAVLSSLVPKRILPPWAPLVVPETNASIQATALVPSVLFVLIQDSRPIAAVLVVVAEASSIPPPFCAELKIVSVVSPAVAPVVLYLGEVVPIPTCPALVILTRSVELVPRTSG